MAKPTPRCFIDSCVLIPYLEGKDDGHHVRQLLYEAAAGRVQVVLSTLVMLEITRKPGAPVDLETKGTILRFLEHRYIFIQDLDYLTASRAFDLIFEHPWLRPADAGHLAAAIESDCKVFYTVDQQLLDRFDGQHGLKVVRPGTPVNYEPSHDFNDLEIFRQSRNDSDR